MRAVALLAAGLVLAGCASPFDQIRVSLRERFTGERAPPYSVRETPEPKARAASCPAPWVREPGPRRRGDLLINGVTFRGLGLERPPWYYSTARELARHLRAGDDPYLRPQDARDLADQAMSNGADAYVADTTLVDVPAGSPVEISVGPSREAGIVVHAMNRYGGFQPGEGVSRVRCVPDRDDATSFHIGFVIAGARCVPLTVTVVGARVSETRNVAFGVERCA